jgi:hypothetical protein
MGMASAETRWTAAMVRALPDDGFTRVDLADCFRDVTGEGREALVR